jgi:two-component system response regulator DegU
MAVRIVLADDHTLFREMLREGLSRKEDYSVVAEAADGATTLSLVARYQPDLLLLDYKMPRLRRLSTFCEQLTKKSPSTRIVLVSGYMEETIALEAAMAAVHGYVVKGTSFANLLRAIATVTAGGVWVDPSLPPTMFRAFLGKHRGEHESLIRTLSRQELNVLSLVAQRMSNKKIAAQLYISEKTVKNHLTRIFAKLGVTDREQAVQSFLAGNKTSTAEKSEADPSAPREFVGILKPVRSKRHLSPNHSASHSENLSNHKT